MRLPEIKGRYLHLFSSKLISVWLPDPLTILGHTNRKALSVTATFTVVPRRQGNRAGSPVSAGVPLVIAFAYCPPKETLCSRKEGENSNYTLFMFFARLGKERGPLAFFSTISLKNT